MTDIPVPTRDDGVGIIAGTGSRDMGSAVYADVDSVFLWETKFILRGIEVLESAFREYRSSNNDEGDDDEEAFGRVKNEMRKTQASLHTLAEDNIAFKSDHYRPTLGDEMKERIAIYEELARRFQKVIEGFEKVHSNQLGALEKWLHLLTQGTNLRIEGREGTTELSTPVDDYISKMVLREVEHKIQACFQDKKKLEDRIYYMKHLIADMNTILTVQKGLLNDIDTKSDGNRGDAAVGSFRTMPFWVVFAWLLLWFLVISLAAVGLFMKFKPQMFSQPEKPTVKAIMGGTGPANPTAGLQY